MASADARPAGVMWATTGLSKMRVGRVAGHQTLKVMGGQRLLPAVHHGLNLGPGAGTDCCVHVSRRVHAPSVSAGRFGLPRNIPYLSWLACPPIPPRRSPPATLTSPPSP